MRMYFCKMQIFRTVNLNFQENKVASGLTKLQNCQGKVNQSRLDLFFKSAGST